ncbi:MAG TPA: glycosyltransferase [Gemmatimonadaceae bacterium]|nr:glycosyltransferase [Gemmatimonadaceae bacterium]
MTVAPATTMGPEVSVIVPTRALAVRADLLQRAVASVLAQDGVRAHPIVVVNGQSRDDAIVERVRADRRVKVIDLHDASLPMALALGLSHVTTPFVATLDDDDLLPPGALRRRVEELVAHPDVDVVVTNGLRRHLGSDVLHVTHVDLVQRDPLHALFTDNWLLPGSWLARAAAVQPGLFDQMPAHLECTFLAIRFATAYRMRFIAEPTVVWHTDSPSAESRSIAYRDGQPAAHHALMQIPMPAWVRSELATRARKVSRWTAGECLSDGDVALAYSWYRRTLRESGGLRHIGFGARIAAVWLLRAARGRARASGIGATARPRIDDVAVD